MRDRASALLLIIPLVGACKLVGEPCGNRCEKDDPDAGVDSPSDTPPAETPRTCLDALHHGVTTDGMVMIDPDGSGPAAPFAAYCDMTTGGGGWTLVWAYGFRDFGNFNGGGNAVQPRPSWNPNGGGTTISTTIPTSPSLMGAMDFNRWKDFGTEFLITSTVNNWIQCTAAGGSLVTLATGAISCTVVKPMTDNANCTATAPVELGLWNNWPTLRRVAGNNNTLYYLWEGTTNAYWPTHDPCGNNSGNPGVASPTGTAGGAVYIRGT